LNWSTENPGLLEVVQPEAQYDGGQPTYHQEILRATRVCVQYGTCGFAVLCIVVGAVESLFGR
jgi:hypothetical protein